MISTTPYRRFTTLYPRYISLFNFEYSLYIMTLKLAYTNCVIWREPSFCAVGPLDDPLFSHYLL